MDPSGWPYTEPHVAFKRFRVLIHGASIKGMDRETALALAEDHSGFVDCSTVVFVTGGWTAGTEVLGAWRRIYPEPPRAPIPTVPTTTVPLDPPPQKD